MTSTAVAAMPKIMSVRCRRRACVTVSGGLKIATSTASAATTVKAARWCRKAMSADAGMGVTPCACVMSLLVPAGLVAQPFGACQAVLAREAPFARGARRTGRGAHLGDYQRAADEIRQPLLGIAPVALLGAMTAGDDED